MIDLKERRTEVWECSVCSERIEVELIKKIGSKEFYKCISGNLAIHEAEHKETLDPYSWIIVKTVWEGDF
jgi:hypothetical protein